MFIETYRNKKKMKCYNVIINQTMITIYLPPLEISCFTKFLLDRGATLTATFSSTHYRRSTPVQGGLEIPCVANAKVISTIKNK